MMDTLALYGLMFVLGFALGTFVGIGIYYLVGKN